MHRGVVGDAGADRIPGAAIGDEAVAECEDAGRRRRSPPRHRGSGRANGRRHMRCSCRSSIHRTGRFTGAREERNQQFLGIDVALDAETAADVERDAADARLGHARARWTASRRTQCTTWVGRPDRNRVGAFVVIADDAAALHRHRSIAVMVEAPLEPVRRARQRGLDVALGDGETRRSGWCRICHAGPERRARAPLRDPRWPAAARDRGSTSSAASSAR